MPAITPLDLAREKYNIYYGQSEKRHIETNNTDFLGYKLRARLTTDLGELGFALYDPKSDKIFNLWIHQNLVVVDILSKRSLRPMNSIAHQITPFNIDPTPVNMDPKQFPNTLNIDLFDTDNAYYVSTYFPRVGDTLAEIRHYKNGDQVTLEHEYSNPPMTQVFNEQDPSIVYLDVTNHIYHSEGTEAGRSFVCDYEYNQQDECYKPCWKRHYTFSDNSTREETVSVGAGCLVSSKRDVSNGTYRKTYFSYKNFSIMTALGEFVFYALNQQIELYQKQMRVFQYSDKKALPTSCQDISLEDKLLAQGKIVHNQNGQQLSFRTTELIEPKKNIWSWLFPFSAHKLIEGKVTNSQYENNKYKCHTVIENTKTKKSRETFVYNRKIRSITLENGVLTRTRFLKDGTEHTKITKRLKNGIDYVELKNGQVVAKGFYHKNGYFHIVGENGFKGRDRKGYYTGVVISENEMQKIEQRTYKKGKTNVLIFDLLKQKVKVMSKKSYDKMIAKRALQKAKARLKRMKAKGLFSKSSAKLTPVCEQDSIHHILKDDIKGVSDRLGIDLSKEANDKQQSEKKQGCALLLFGLFSVAVALATCTPNNHENKIESDKKPEPAWLGDPWFAQHKEVMPRLPDIEKRVQPKGRPVLVKRLNDDRQRQNA